MRKHLLTLLILLAVITVLPYIWSVKSYAMAGYDILFDRDNKTITFIITPPFLNTQCGCLGSETIKLHEIDDYPRIIISDEWTDIDGNTFTKFSPGVKYRYHAKIISMQGPSDSSAPDIRDYDISILSINTKKPIDWRDGTVSVTKTPSTPGLAKTYIVEITIDVDAYEAPSCDKGSKTVDLSKGENKSKDDGLYNTLMRLFYNFENDFNFYDLDHDGNNDIALSIPELYNGYVDILKLESTKLRKYTASLSDANKEYYNGLETEYYSSIKFIFYKKTNPMTVKPRTATVRYSKLKKRTQYLRRDKVLTIKKKKGRLSFEKKKGNRKITIDSSTGKVKVKKGLKKGKYRIRVKVKDKGNDDFKSKSKTVWFTVRVR